jgi:hypothetical protein
MNTTEIITSILLIGSIGALLRYLAHRFPNVYLRVSDVISWGAHTSALGFAFGVGVVTGRYGFSEHGLDLAWTFANVGFLTLLYLTAVLYHEYLRSHAAARRREPRLATPSTI